MPPDQNWRQKVIEKSWYYAREGTRFGPVDGALIERYLHDGTLTPRSLVWREGLDGWEQAGAHFAVPAPAPGTPPAIPPTMPDVRGIPRAGSTRRTPGRDTHHDPRELVGADGMYIHAPARGFGEAVSVCLRRYFSFSGRASRSEYWYFFLFTVLMGIVAAILDSLLFGYSWEDEVSPLNSLVNLALLIPTLAVGWRRLHDTNRSGWWIGGFFLALVGGAVMIAFMGASGGYVGVISGSALLGLIVLIYFIVMLVFLCTRGDPGPNRYG